jgi:hypothetical protein
MQQRENVCQLLSLFYRTLVSKYTHMHINETRHYFLYTNKFTIAARVLAYQLAYMYMFENGGIFLSSYFIMNDRVRTKETKIENEKRRNMGEESDLC